MEFKLKEKMKELRKANGNTQEELAGFLGITVQAVSKWERGEGMPDITYLPQIAGFYSITVDDLLGVGEAAKKAREKEIMAEYDRIRLSNGISEDGTIIITSEMRKESIELLRGAIREQPDNPSFKNYLAWHLFAHSKGKKDDEKTALLNEAEALCRKVLKNCQDMQIRNDVSRALCLILNETGNKQQAREMAEEMPGIYQSSDWILTDILEGEELEQQLIQTADRLASALNECVKKLCREGFDIKALREKDPLKFRLEKIMDAIYND